MRLAGTCPNCGHTKLMTWGVGVACGYCMGYWPPDRLCQDGLPVGLPGILSDHRPPRPLTSERAYQLLATREPEGLVLEGVDALDVVGQAAALVVSLGVACQLAEKIAEYTNDGPSSLAAMLHDLVDVARPIEQLLARTMGAAGIGYDAQVRWSDRPGGPPCP